MRANRSRAAKQALSIVLLIGTLSLGQLPPQVARFPRQFTMDVAAAPAAPLNAVAAAFGRVLALSGSGRSAGDLEREVRQLTEALAETQAELARARETVDSYQRFVSLPARAPIYVWNTSLHGYIVGGDPDVFTRSYVADIGSRDGVSRGMPVAWGNVAAGVISEVGLWHSKVRVLSDPRSRICIRFARSGREGVLAGTGRANCVVRFVPNQVNDNEIQAGDIVVTSGTDVIFPPGLLVGRVVRFAKRPAEPSADVEVELTADFSRIGTCLVLKGPVEASPR